MNEQEKNQDKLLDSALLEKLAMTYEERIESHENARRLALELSQAGKDFRAGSSKTS